ncbi:MAG TPA: putative Ig domain-containing protein [Candidatus Baltobacterales bacterium]|nr:putative Ig domain-containing protein [Candidatus Baltobacterales bacterium]
MTALLVLLGGCALPNCSPKTTGSNSAATTPIPSPSPTLTSQLQASTPPFHAGEVGVAYTPVTLAATGGVQPYTWTITTGALPDGLTLGSDGSVSGTPTRAGGFSFTIQLADSGGSANALPGTIAIAAAPAASLVTGCARYCSVEVGCVDVCGNFGTLTGGTAPFTYTMQPGGLVPVGTHLNQLSLAGTFAQRAQYWQFSVLVTDALGQTASISPTFYVYPHISLTSGSCLGGYPASCSVRLAISGGTPGGTPTVKLLGEAPYVPPSGFGRCWPSTTTPPAGYGLSVGGGYVTVSIPQKLGSGYGAIWSLQLTDQSVCSAGTSCQSPVATVAIGVQCS